jgi:hypothetical protein
MRRRLLLSALGGFALLISSVLPAAAITGGVPDGDGHPYSALLLVPGETFCSGTLIDEDVILTAGHCTDGWDEAGYDEVWVTFDPVAAVDQETWLPIEGEGTWYVADEWVTHPEYVADEWPFTYDYGLVLLDEPVEGITPATLPEPYVVDRIIGTSGQTAATFNDVGYGQDGVNNGEKPYTRNFDFIRKVSNQRYSPSNGAVGTQDPLWLILGSAQADSKGSGCGGDSGSGIFVAGTDTIVAVHTGGYRMGYLDRLCGRITSLNHRIDSPELLAWIAKYTEDAKVKGGRK